MTINLEFCVYAVCSIFVLFFAVPRLWAVIELNLLRTINEPLMGKVPHLPVGIQSKQEYRVAAASVQKALTRNHRNFKYHIKVINIVDPIEASIRVEGVTDISLSRKAHATSQYKDTSKTTKIMMTVRVDVTKYGDGSKIVWRYLPSDPSLFQSQVQIHDPNIDYLLARTNYVLMSHLKPLVT
ncbi:hypothetical protein BH11CYA1_BH11CYA1_38430 [soil metagenome]